MAALEILVRRDHPKHLIANIGPKNLRGDTRVIDDRDQLAHIVQQGRHNYLLVGSIIFGPSRRLDGMFELMHRESVGDVRKTVQHLQNLVGHPRLCLHRHGRDVHPLFGRGFVHAGETFGHSNILPRLKE